MPRDSSGGYTLPASNPVVADTDITTTWANTTLADIAGALEDSLSRSGDGGMLNPFPTVDGTEIEPGFTFKNATGTGFWRSTAGLSVSIAATRIATWMSTGLKIVSGYFKSEVANGASAVAFTLDSGSTYSTSGAKLLSVQNSGSETFFVDKDGELAANGGLATGTGTITSGVGDSASAVAITVDTSNALTTTGAKLLSLKNGGVEKFAIDKDGKVVVGTQDFNYVLGDSTGTFSSASTSWEAVTNCSCALTVSGARPVEASLVHDRTGNVGYVQVTYAESGTDTAYFRLTRTYSAWAALTAYAVGTNISSGDKSYVCTTAGTSGAVAPAGTGSSITDGTCVWSYVTASPVVAGTGPVGGTGYSVGLGVDEPGLGTCTYAVDVVTGSGVATIGIAYMRLYVKEE